MIYRIKKIIRDLSHVNKRVATLYIIMNRIKIRVLSKISDEKFAKLKYKENTGKKLNLENPKTFNEKLWWLKINNRDPALTKCSDKVRVREYVKSKGLEDILIPIFGVYDDAREIDFSKLPDRAFIKTSHGSGTNAIWEPGKYFDREKFVKKFNATLKMNYYFQSREWNYKDIEPKIIIEKILEEKTYNSIVDYRFLCFNGKVKLIFVDIETAAEDGTHSPYAKRNVYDPDFNYLDIKVSRDQFDKNYIDKPKNANRMIEIAEALSNEFVFARVDLYNIDGAIYFGEITFYPGGCTQLFEQDKWEYLTGEWIDLNSEKIIVKDI